MTGNILETVFSLKRGDQVEKCYTVTERIRNTDRQTDIQTDRLSQIEKQEKQN